MIIFFRFFGKKIYIEKEVDSEVKKLHMVWILVFFLELSRDWEGAEDNLDSRLKYCSNRLHSGGLFDSN